MSSKINDFQYPKCLVHPKQELNQVCIEEDCFFQFHPVCVLCQYDKEYHCSQHAKKPLLIILTELQDLTKPEALRLYPSILTLEKDMSLLATQFRSIADKCIEISQNISISINKFSRTLENLSPESKSIEHLLEKIENDPSAQSLRLHLLQAKEYIKVGDNGLLQLSLTKADQVERVSQRFERYFQKIEQIYSQVVNDLNNAQRSSIFFTGVEFAKGSAGIYQCTQTIITQQLISLFVIPIITRNEFESYLKEKKRTRQNGENISDIKLQSSADITQEIDRMRSVMKSPQKTSMTISEESQFKVKVYRKGDNKTFPSQRQKVKINYKIFDEDFTLLEENKEGMPFTFVLGIGQVIQGWEMAIPQMSLGEKSLIVCNRELINNSKYRSLSSSISSLFFEIELLDII